MRDLDFTQLAANIKAWALKLGFGQAGISDIDLTLAQKRLTDWLAKGFHGSMHYLNENCEVRAHPDKMLPGTVRIISVRMDYFPPSRSAKKVLQNGKLAYISRYALGRDYHKLMRKRLQKLANKITQEVGEFGYRAFTDSAPVHERAIAEKAGIGWTGKNTLIMNRNAGSFFFLGELYTDLPLPIDQPISEHCGSCRACIDVCPTQAIVAPYQLDARRCISYLTIENKGPIPIEFRKQMGNRIYGCDDCQLFCPWNKFADFTKESDFHPRHGLDEISLCEIFAWSEPEFLKNTEGSAMRRATYIGLLRNIAVALGNAPTSDQVINALKSRANHPSKLIREHVSWALKQHAACF